MKRWFAYLLLGLLAYALFMLWLFPATFAWSYAEPALRQQLPQLAVNGVSGRLWQGEAAAVRYNNTPVGRLHWRISPLSLFTGKVNAPLSLQLQQGYLQGRVSMPFDQSEMRISTMKGQLPVTQLQGLFAYYPVSVAGTLAVDISEAQVDGKGKLTGLSGRINWLGAELVAPQALLLGDLQAELEADEAGRMTAQLSDRGGPLSLDAQLVLQPQGSYTLSGTVAAGEGASDELRQALGWLGKPDQRGRYRLNWRGRL